MIDTLAAAESSRMLEAILLLNRTEDASWGGAGGRVVLVDRGENEMSSFQKDVNGHATR